MSFFVMVDGGDSLINKIQTCSLLFYVLLSGANISDYFNYGFDEESWNNYCKKQTRLRVAYNVYIGAIVRFTDVLWFVNNFKNISKMKI